MKSIVKTGIIYFFFVIIGMFPCVSRGETFHIRVDASKDLGSPPQILRSNIWIQNLENQGGASYIIDKFFKDNNPAVVQLSLPILQGTRSFENFKNALERYFKMPSSVSLVDKVKEYNSLVIIGFDPCPMPAWLSANPGNLEKISDWGGTVQTCSPPKDYELWGEVVKYTLNYLRLLGLNNLGFYVGHEQERDWVGNEESFFQYYAETAYAAKSIDKKIKVGGPGPSWATATRHNCDSYPSETVRSMCARDGGWADPENEPFIKNFIEYVAENNIPLDFINWHAFNALPSDFQKTVTLIEGWLKENGLKDVNLYPSDWSYWSFPPYPDDLLDNQETAAYIVTSVYHMWKTGIDWHGHDFDVRDYSGRENAVKRARNNSTFIGDWSIFTWGGLPGGGIMKPMYNALKAISIATREDTDGPLKVIETSSSPTENLTAFATLADNRSRISLLISNFTPGDEKRFKKFMFFAVDSQTDFLEEEKKQIKEYLKQGGRKETKDVLLSSINQVASSLNDPRKIEALHFIAKAFEGSRNEKGISPLYSASKELKYTENKKLADTIMHILDAREKPAGVQIHFTNIPFEGKAKLTIYTIDSTHSNSCSFNKSTEPARTHAPCGIGGAIDRAVWDAREKAQKVGVKVAEEYLLSIGYTDREVRFLKDSIERCKKSRDIKECLNKLLREKIFKSTHPAKKLKEDLKETFKRYNESYHTAYYTAIDEINHWKEVSLEGSEKVDMITIQNNSYDLNIEMEPNSVLLAVISKEEK
jgi:hypothetical protein